MTRRLSLRHVALGYVAFLCSAIAPVWAATPWAAGPPAVESALLRLDTAATRRQLSALRASDAELASFYANHGLFLLALSTQDPARIEAYYAASSRYLDRLAQDSYRRRCFAAEVYFERALLKGIEQRNFAAYFEVRRCYSLLRELDRTDPQRPDHQKLLGTFDVMISAVPKSYQWLTRLLGFRGDLQGGERRLAQAAHQASWMRTEAELAVALAERNVLGREEEGLARLDSVRAQANGSPIVDFLLASALLEAKRLAAAEAVLVSAAARAPVGPAMPFLEYLRGRLALVKANWPQAKLNFERFLGYPNSVLLRRAATMRIGLCNALLGNPVQAKASMTAVTQLKSSLADEDAYAIRLAREYLAQPYSEVDLALLRARLAFDGGELRPALQSLEPLARQPLALPQQIEVFYRLGRVHHELGASARAEGYYRSILPLEAGNRLWMRVYSLYYLGQIAEAAHEPLRARWYYNQVLATTGYDYQSGLETKARAALARLDAAKTSKVPAKVTQKTDAGADSAR